MAYTKYSLTPANNNATPPDGAPEGMLPSAVNDTMRDMMAQIRDCGDGIRDGTYTMTAPKITGGTITGAAFTGNTFTSPVISGGSINNTPIGGSTAAAGTFTSLSDSGNLTFTGTGNRITGDFSNATIANRVMFQTSTTNGGSTIYAIPNGTGTFAGFYASAQSDPTNASFLSIFASSGASESRIASNINGTGTYYPLTMYTGGSERLRIDTSGNVGIGLTPTASVGALQVSGGAFASSTLYVGQTGSTAFSGGIQNLSNTSRSISIEADPTNAGANSLMYFNVDGTTRMAIDSSGNVGIGTSSPAATLTVAHASGVDGRGIRLVNSSNSQTWENRIGVQSLENTSYAIKDITAGSVRFLITTAGNVGIGTTSPSYPLDVQGSGNTAVRLQIRNTNNGSSANSYFTLGNDTGDSNAGLILGSSTNSVYGNNTLAVYQSNNAPLTFWTNNSEKMRITSDGNLLIGSTANDNTSVGNKIQASGGAIFVQSSTGDGPLTQFNNINASITNGYRFASFRINSGATEKGTITYNTGTGQVNYNQTSDRRLKTNIKPAKEALSIISQIKVVSFDMLSGGHTEYGVIAQDLKDIFPEAVSEGDSEKEVQKAWGVDTSNLVPALVKAIQEQQAMIEELKQEVAALKAK